MGRDGRTERRNPKILDTKMESVNNTKWRIGKLYSFKGQT